MLDFRFYRFLIVGLANTFTGLLIIYSCKWLLEMGDVSANMVGYGIGMLLGFLLNKLWTFSHIGRLWVALLRYLVVIACAYIFNLTTVLYAIGDLHLNSYLAQALGVIPYTAISYFGSRYFAFKKEICKEAISQ